VSGVSDLGFVIIDFRLLIVSFVVYGLWFVVWDVRVSQAKRAERSGLP
jgi:hypothetical protein